VVIVEGEGAVSGVNLGRPIVTNGAFVASLCGSAYRDRAVVWRGEWGGPWHSCRPIRWKSTCLKGKGLFLAWFLAFFSICTRIRFNGWNDVLIADRLVCENLTIFPYAEYIVEICVELAFSGFLSQVQDRSGGWREMYTNVTVKTRNMEIPTIPAASQQEADAITLIGLLSAQFINRLWLSIRRQNTQ